MNSNFQLHPLSPEDHDWVARFITWHWGAEFVVAHGEIYTPARLPGFAAVQDGEIVGLVTYTLAGKACEVVTLDSLQPSQGIGTALIAAVKTAALRAGCRRLWLITTNDNLNALRFYQKRGFTLVAVHRNVIEHARRLKPISLIGEHGIPIRDEIELELMLE